MDDMVSWENESVSSEEWNREELLSPAEYQALNAFFSSGVNLVSIVEKSDLFGKTKNELKEICRAKNLKVSGTKSDLATRIWDADHPTT